MVVRATDIAGAAVSDKYTLTVNKTTGFNELESKEFKVYPNPTKGKLSIEKASFNADTRFIVRDYHGKVVLEKLAEGTKTVLNLQGLSDGIYFIEIANGKENNILRVILNK